MSKEVLLGPQAKVDIVVGGIEYALRVVAGQYRDSGDKVETTDSESFIGYKDNQVGDGELTVNLELQLDTDAINPTSQMATSPMYLSRGNVVGIKIWPEGRGEGQPVYCEFLNIVDVSGSFGIQGSRPQTGSISGVSSGYYSMPYQG